MIDISIALLNQLHENSSFSLRVVKRAKFFELIQPGDQVEIFCEKKEKDSWFVSWKRKVDDKKLVQFELL